MRASYKSGGVIKTFVNYQIPFNCLKAAGGGKGRNIVVIKDIDYSRKEIIFTTIFRHLLSFTDITSHLEIKNSGFLYRGYILEARVEQCREIGRINPWTLNSVRALNFLKKDKLTASRNPYKTILYGLLYYGGIVGI